MENVCIESFNGRWRDECLNVHQVASLAEAQAIIEAWRCDYNQRRPHSSRAHLTPNEFVVQRQGHRSSQKSSALVKTVSERGQRHLGLPRLSRTLKDGLVRAWED